MGFCSYGQRDHGHHKYQNGTHQVKRSHAGGRHLDTSCCSCHDDDDPPKWAQITLLQRPEFPQLAGNQSHSVSKTLDISTKMGCRESLIRSSALSRSEVFLWRKYHLTHSWIDIAFLFQATWSKNQSYFVAVQRASSWRQLCWQVLDHWSVVVLETFPGIEEKLGKKGWRLFLCSSSTSAAAQFPWLECVSATFLRHAENDVERSSSSSSLPAQKQLEVHNSSF